MGWGWGNIGTCMHVYQGNYRTYILDCLLLVNLSTRQTSKYRSRHDVKSWGQDDFCLRRKGEGYFTV